MNGDGSIQLVRAMNDKRPKFDQFNSLEDLNFAKEGTATLDPNQKPKARSKFYS